MKLLSSLLLGNAAAACGLVWIAQSNVLRDIPSRPEQDIAPMERPLRSAPETDGISADRLAKARTLFGASLASQREVVAPKLEPIVAASVTKPVAIELVGVLLADANRVALIRYGENGEVKRIVLGAAVERWQVVRIDARSILLREGLQEREVKLGTNMKLN